MVNKQRNVKHLLKSYYWEKLTFSKFRFSKFKKFVFRPVFEELQLTQISLNFKTSCYNLKIRGLVAKLLWIFYNFNFERKYDVLKSPCILLNKNINFNKNGKSHTQFLKDELNSYKNHKIKLKLWWVGARERKKKVLFVPFILSKGFFLTLVFYLNL